MPLPPDVGVIVTPRSAIPPGLAPHFAEAVRSVLDRMTAGGFSPKIFRGLATDEEQREAFDHGYSKAKDADHSWHGYGLAADIADAKLGWHASSLFWKALQQCVTDAGLRSGATFVHFPDVAHVQWGRCPVSPGSFDIFHRDRSEGAGMQFLWAYYGASDLDAAEQGGSTA